MLEIAWEGVGRSWENRSQGNTIAIAEGIENLGEEAMEGGKKRG